MKKFDFEKALKELDEEELDEEQVQKAKILMKVLPFVIIILILAGMLLVSALKKDANDLTGTSAGTTSTGTEENELQTEAPSAVPTENPSEAPTEAPSAVPTENPYEAPTETPSKNASDVSDITEITYVNEPFNAENQLAELYDYFVSDNRKAIEDLVHLDRYKAMSYSLKGTEEFYYFGEKNGEGKPHGKGIAVYADNRYYYGDWAGGQRNGGGFFIHYHMPECYTENNLVIYHQFTGNWKNDVPEGEGAEHYEYETDRLKKNTGYNTNLLGSYQNGLIHGDFFITNLYSDGNVKEWDAKAKNGSWVYQSDSKDSVGRGPVFRDRKDEDNYIWLHPDDNQKLGIGCLTLSQKN